MSAPHFTDIDLTAPSAPDADAMKPPPSYTAATGNPPYPTNDNIGIGAGVYTVPMPQAPLPGTYPVYPRPSCTPSVHVIEPCCDHQTTVIVGHHHPIATPLQASRIRRVVIVMFCLSLVLIIAIPIIVITTHKDPKPSGFN